MKSKEQLIEEFHAFIPFAQSLQALNLEKWNSPLEQGKWSTRDIISHIMLWDKYFLEAAIEKISAQETLTLQHLDYDEFNQNAITYAKTRSQEQLIAETVHYRSELLAHLRQIPEDSYNKQFIDAEGHPFVISVYISDFIPHDQGHRQQIEAFINNTNQGQ